MKKKFHYERKDRMHDIGDKMTALLLTIKYCYREDVTEKMIATGITLMYIYSSRTEDSFHFTNSISVTYSNGNLIGLPVLQCILAYDQFLLSTISR